MYPPSWDQLGYPMGILTSSCHFWLTRSNSISLSEFLVIAAMYFPSGDQRGEKSWLALGRMVVFPVFTSTVTMPGRLAIPACEVASFRLTTIDLPSGDHPGSNPA